MTFIELPQRWKILVGGVRHELTISEILALRSACDQILEHRSKSVENVIAFICKSFELEKFELLSRNRQHERCLARWCAWRILKDQGMSYYEIARQFRKDHGTVLSGLRRLSELLKTNSHLRERLEWIKGQEKK